MAIKVPPEEKTLRIVGFGIVFRIEMHRVSWSILTDVHLRSLVQIHNRLSKLEHFNGDADQEGLVESDMGKPNLVKNQG